MLRRAGKGRWRGAVGACTEGLGSDSGDVGGAEIDQLPAAAAGGAGVEEAPGVEPSQVAVPPPEEKRRRRGGLLPPAMPRAAEGLAMRAERRGGRLILTEVRAAERERRGLFRASRDGGRLLLRFADSASNDDDDGSSGEPEAAGSSAAAAGGGGFSGGELCQVAAAGAAGRTRVEVGAVIEI
ncbi:hypothetical protein GQ55_8G241100 [Panicum hallii var. hallii]|uniref:FAF domain-containing protein n=1 Tax=Panicum hallii var. hallii TaxID=1504633 RepID=A0A2T7CQM0_9POAL|nr:hypothetical protein GQ55_8G241100 [Panicum hallii var. hallii]